MKPVNDLKPKKGNTLVVSPNDSIILSKQNKIPIKENERVVYIGILLPEEKNDHMIKVERSRTILVKGSQNVFTSVERG